MEREISSQYPLQVMIRDRTGTLFEGAVEALSSENDSGPFDILGMHINFVSIIHSLLTLHFPGGSSQKLSFETGVLALQDNRVEVYIGIIK